MSGLGTAMSGGKRTNSDKPRRGDDYYPTPPEATAALARAEGVRLAGARIWEFACGDGVMASTLTRCGLNVARASDLVDRGFGEPRVDFLATTSRGDCDAGITNPPFNLAPKFIRHALLELRLPYLALLLKSQFWHAARRSSLFEACPPSVLYPMTWRVDFLQQGAPTMDTMWCVWDQCRPGTAYRLLHKSDADEAMDALI